MDEECEEGYGTADAGELRGRKLLGRMSCGREFQGHKVPVGKARAELLP